MPNTRGGSATKSPQDFTGKQQEKEREAAIEAQAQRQQEMSMATAAEVSRKRDITIDYTDPDNPVEKPNTGFPGATDVEIDDEPIIASGATRTIVLVGDHEFTHGKNPATGTFNTYKFEGGVRYTVPFDVADHLDEKGWVYSS